MFFVCVHKNMLWPLDEILGMAFQVNTNLMCLRNILHADSFSNFLNWIDGLAQDFSISIANIQSRTKPSTWTNTSQSAFPSLHDKFSSFVSL